MDSAPVPHVGLEELDDGDCLARLGSSHLGRIALSVGALPAVFPIHFAMLGRDPVFRTDSGTKLRDASAGHIVCLQVDDVDNELHSGWSVMVIGRAEVITEASELAEAALLPLRPWVGPGDEFVRIRSGLLSGRRVHGASPGARPATGDRSVAHRA